MSASVPSRTTSAARPFADSRRASGRTTTVTGPSTPADCTRAPASSVTQPCARRAAKTLASPMKVETKRVLGAA